MDGWSKLHQMERNKRPKCQLDLTLKRETGVTLREGSCRQMKEDQRRKRGRCKEKKRNLSIKRSYFRVGLPYIFVCLNIME